MTLTCWPKWTVVDWGKGGGRGEGGRGEGGRGGGGGSLLFLSCWFCERGSGNRTVSELCSPGVGGVAHIIWLWTSYFTHASDTLGNSCGSPPCSPRCCR